MITGGTHGLEATWIHMESYGPTAQRLDRPFGWPGPGGLICSESPLDAWKFLEPQNEMSLNNT